jgi:serine/threonine-protein kinase RsbW
MRETTTTAPALAWSRTFPGRPDQVREARAFLRAVLESCPVANDVVLCMSEMAANSCLHSDSAKAGGTFAVRAEVHPDDYVWVEVEDNGGRWEHRAHTDGRPHGLDIVGELAAAWGIDGDPLTGWVAWARFDLPLAGPPPAVAGQPRPAQATAPASDPAHAATVVTDPARRAATTSQALTGLRDALAARGIATTGMTLTRHTGKLHPAHGPAIGYHGGLYWWPVRRLHASKPIYAIHDARDPAGAARRIAPHHQPATPGEH